MEAPFETTGSTGPAGRQDPSLPQVFGRYLLIQRLSRGGMGEIFLAKHGLAGFEKLAVIKKVLPHLAADASFISRFVDEAQVAIKLQHVNVAQVFEVGRLGDEYFLALEYIEGRDLRRTIGALNANRQRMPNDLALFVGRELANGLAYAHRRTDNNGALLNLVHCDISPPNVLVSFEGETKVIDFGIAKSVLRGTVTDPKMGFGKFGYMAPEQLIRGGVVDFRTDIYAAGVVLFELLTGTRLYEAGAEPDYRNLARKVSKGEHTLPSEVDASLAPFDDLVATALRPRPEDRYQSAAELRDAIQQSLVGLNPTISTDQLGAFMRELFADEMLAQKELHDRIAQTHLADFQVQITTQSVSTVSFALANLPSSTQSDATATLQARPRNRPLTQPPPLPAPPVSASAKAPKTPARGVSATPSSSSAPGPARMTSTTESVVTKLDTSDLALADGTGTADRIALESLLEPDDAEPAAPSRRSKIFAMVCVGAVVIALGAWAATRGSSSPATVVGPSPGGSAALPAEHVTAEPIVSPGSGSASTPAPNALTTNGSAIANGSAASPPELQVGSDGSAANVAVAASSDGSATRPAVVPTTPPSRVSATGQRKPHHNAGAKPAPQVASAQPAVTRDEVIQKFRAVAAEYDAYKAKYGMRLDHEWNDLSLYVQYKSDSNLEELVRRIDTFRAKLH